MNVFVQITDGDGRRMDQLSSVPWLWGIEPPYPGLGAIVLACDAAYREAFSGAWKRRHPAK